MAKRATKSAKPSGSGRIAGTSRETVLTGKRNQAPDEERIRIKANEFYNERIMCNIEGNAENDWLAAEQYLISQIPGEQE